MVKVIYLHVTRDVHLRKSSLYVPWKRAPSHGLDELDGVVAGRPSPTIVPLENLGSPRPPAASFASITLASLALRVGSPGGVNWVMTLPTGCDGVPTISDTGDPS